MVPRSVERLVEGVCASKHIIHVCHVGHVPIIERLVEGFCAQKHTINTRHIGHVPIVERLVEGACGVKHFSHIDHFGHVPIIERLVERRARSFNRPLNNWNVSKVETMFAMFDDATSLNQPLHAPWYH